jgi:hypothetical protein
VRTARSECLDWMLVLNQQHLERVLAVFVTHYNEHRPHRARSLAPPAPRQHLSVASAAGDAHVHRRDRLGGVVREYVLAAYRVFAPYTSSDCCPPSFEVSRRRKSSRGSGHASLTDGHLLDEVFSVGDHMVGAAPEASRTTATTASSAGMKSSTRTPSNVRSGCWLPPLDRVIVLVPHNPNSLASNVAREPERSGCIWRDSRCAALWMLLLKRQWLSLLVQGVQTSAMQRVRTSAGGRVPGGRVPRSLAGDPRNNPSERQRRCAARVRPGTQVLCCQHV